MQPEERHMLERLLRMTEQNNHILVKMHREVVMRKYYRLLKFALAVAIGVVIYYYIRPYITDLIEAINTADQLKTLYTPR